MTVEIVADTGRLATLEMEITFYREDYTDCQWLTGQIQASKKREIQFRKYEYISHLTSNSGKISLV